MCQLLGMSGITTESDESSVFDLRVGQGSEKLPEKKEKDFVKSVLQAKPIPSK
jgi:hypothetical protein